MLADYFTPEIVKSQPVYDLLSNESPEGQETQHLVDLAVLLHAPRTLRFVFTPAVFKLTQEIIDSFEERANTLQASDEFWEMMRSVFLPGHKVWIESVSPNSTEHRQFGFLLQGVAREDDPEGLKRADVTYIGMNAKKEVTVMPPFLIDFIKGDIQSYYSEMPFDLRLAIARISFSVVVSLSLINQPRITYSKPSNLSKLNKQRLRKGKEALAEYREVNITLDASGARFLSKKAAQSETGDGVKRRLHHVRAFIRTKRGKLELVRPHWRGSAEAGVVKHGYKVRTKEDA